MFELLKKNFKEIIEIIIRYSEQFREKYFSIRLEHFTALQKKSKNNIGGSILRETGMHSDT